MGKKKTLPRLAVSSCLAGQMVRHDGQDASDGYVTGTLSKHFDFELICPETAAGLPSPRPPINLRAGKRITAVMEADGGVEMTDLLTQACHGAVEACAGVCGFVLKSKSPSCAISDARIIGRKIESRGPGLFLRVMTEQRTAPMIDEKGLANADSRHNYLERVFVYRKWLMAGAAMDDSWARKEFHMSMQLLAAIRGPKALAGWRRLAGRAARLGRKEYIARLMTIMAAPSNGKGYRFAIGMVLKDLAGTAPKLRLQRLLVQIGLCQQGQAPWARPLALAARMSEGAPAAAGVRTWLEMEKDFMAPLLLRQRNRSLKKGGR